MSRIHFLSGNYDLGIQYYTGENRTIGKAVAATSSLKYHIIQSIRSISLAAECYVSTDIFAIQDLILNGGEVSIFQLCLHF